MILQRFQCLKLPYVFFLQIPKTTLSQSPTSRMDFKRLLLQQSIKSGPTRISAAEQLKLSRQQCQEGQQQCSSPSKLSNQQTPLTKVLSPRSAWRFQTPRTDVLSSTIIEDAAAEEKAMKPSPETPSPVTHLPPSGIPTTQAPPAMRRKLDMSETSMEEMKNAINENKNMQQFQQYEQQLQHHQQQQQYQPQQQIQSRPLEKKEKEIENRLQAIDDNPIKAIENRRMSNQLARAQFLASNNIASNPNAQKDLFHKRFRARSESPQQNTHQNRVFNSSSPNNQMVTPPPSSVVTRSPSAPTLETAL